MIRAKLLFRGLLCPFRNFATNAPSIKTDIPGPDQLTANKLDVSQPKNAKVSKVLFLGPPNVGKSCIVNKLYMLHRELSISSEFHEILERSKDETDFEHELLEFSKAPSANAESDFQIPNSVSPVPFTTLKSFECSLTNKSTQLICVDTPPLLMDPEKTSNPAYLSYFKNLIDDCDHVCLVAEFGNSSANNLVKNCFEPLFLPLYGQKLFQKDGGKTLSVILNKSDLVTKLNTEAEMDSWLSAFGHGGRDSSSIFNVSDFFISSALNDFGLQKLNRHLSSHAHNGNWQYSSKQTQLISKVDQVAKVVREKILCNFTQADPVFSQTTVGWEEGSSIQIGQIVYCKEKRLFDCLNSVHNDQGTSIAVPQVMDRIKAKVELIQLEAQFELNTIFKKMTTVTIIPILDAEKAKADLPSFLL